MPKKPPSISVVSDNPVNEQTDGVKQIAEIVAKRRELKAQASADKPATGRGGRSNFPSSREHYSKNPDAVKKLLKEALAAYHMPKVQNDDELRQRISDYFAMCAESGQVPTLEELAMSTGYTTSGWYDIETGRSKGFSLDTSKIIKKAKGVMATFDAKMAVAGELNFLAYCFRSKNFYGMTDKQEVVLTPNNPLGDAEATPQLADKYLETVDD